MESNRSLNSNSGFTLIEVLLALAIFTIIGIATVKHIQLIQNTKNLAFEEMDLYNDVRAALSLIRSDLSQAFHVLIDDLGDETKQSLTANQPAPHTLFDGRKNELIFTSMSHRNYYTNRHESEQTEISYFLQRKGKSKYQSLMKRESELIDADLYQGGTIYTLLNNVESMEFQYWDHKQQKWVDDWSSDGGAYRDLFPQAVKIKISVFNDGNRKLEVETQFKVAFPNNEAALGQF